MIKNKVFTNFSLYLNISLIILITFVGRYIVEENLNIKIPFFIPLLMGVLSSLLSFGYKYKIYYIYISILVLSIVILLTTIKNETYYLDGVWVNAKESEFKLTFIKDKILFSGKKDTFKTYYKNNDLNVYDEEELILKVNFTLNKDTFRLLNDSSEVFLKSK